MIFPADRERVAAVMNEAAALNQEFEIQWRLNQPQGEPERWLLFRGKPITDANGASTCYFGVAIDITEQKRLEEAVLESKERLNFALEAGEVGPWEISIETGEVTASDRALSFVDIPPEARPSFPEVLAESIPMIRGLSMKLCSALSRPGTRSRLNGGGRSRMGRSAGWKRGGVPICFRQAGLGGIDPRHNHEDPTKRGGRKGSQSQVRVPLQYVT